MGTKEQLNALFNSTTNGISFALIIHEQNAQMLALGFGGYGKKCSIGCTRRRRDRWNMDDAKLEVKLNELLKEFGGATDPQCVKLAMLAKEAGENQKKLEQSVSSLQESLDYLRICIKYQLFDLEATRRENDYLRKLLEGNS
jgi:hypothetical protein